MFTPLPCIATAAPRWPLRMLLLAACSNQICWCVEWDFGMGRVWATFSPFDNEKSSGLGQVLCSPHFQSIRQHSCSRKVRKKQAPACAARSPPTPSITEGTTYWPHVHMIPACRDAKLVCIPLHSSDLATNDYNYENLN
jgi:hypothetical protein